MNIDSIKFSVAIFLKIVIVKVMRAKKDKINFGLKAFFCLWIFFYSFAMAQTDFDFLRRSKGVDFLVDYACFKEKGENWRLEVYYKIFNEKLSFVKSGERFRASYEVNLTVLDRKGHQITATSLEENFYVNSYSETTSEQDFLINLLQTKIAPGQYKLILKLIDLNSNQRWAQKIDVIVPELDPQKIIFSSLEFARVISDSVKNPKFEKKGKEVIPSVSRIFGNSKFYLYYEIYGKKDPSQEFLLSYEIVDDDKKEKVFEEKETLRFESQTIPLYKTLSVDKLPPGDYTLFIKLLDEKKKTLAKTKKRFSIEWSMLFTLKADYQKAVEQLRYIASRDEIEKLKKAKKEDRLKEWAEFWKSKDPTPETKKNELMDEYYRRLRYTNENFSLWNKEGWETDMGRIYIIYGDPDEIERHPFEMGGKPYQVWYYYDERLKVVFVDKTGTGEWELDYIYDRGVKRK